MKAIEKFAKGKGLELKPAKVKDTPASINSAAKQKELLLKIATDLGYLE
jgi:hypothetical protein